MKCQHDLLSEHLLCAAIVMPGRGEKAEIEEEKEITRLTLF